MANRYGKGLMGGVIVIALLALLIHWIGISTIEHYQADLWFYLQAHLFLVLASMFAALIVGIPAGILLSRPAMATRAERFMQVFNIGNTVPPLAVLAIALGILGIGAGPAIFALFLASLLPIVRNTYEGLKNVEASLKEAATGIGMTPRQVLWKVELPNAVPIIVGGVRIALALNVGTAPLAFLIGANSLGSLIFPGIALNNQPQLILGAACTALLALLLDALGDPGQPPLAGTRAAPGLSKGNDMKRLCILIASALLCAATAQAADKPLIRIGARVFTEQTLLAEITSQYLRGKGYDTQITGGLGSNLARSAQESGQLDMLWEYTGVSLVAYNHVTEKLDSEQSYARVKELDAKKGLVWLTPSKFSNTYALALPQKVAQQYPQINTISQLTTVLAAEEQEHHLVALDTEFANRSDGLDGMVKLYGMNLDRRDHTATDRTTGASGLHRPCATARCSPAWSTPPTAG